jgi:hypothetical protein
MTGATFSIRHLLCGAALLAGLATQASATLIAYEPFDYAAGSILNGQTGGVGFTAAWAPHLANAANVPANPISNAIVAGSLPGPAGLPTLGNSALLSGEFGTLQISRLFPSISGAAGTTTWFSFIGQRLGETSTNVAGNPYPRGANVSLFDADRVGPSPNQPERIAMGNSSNATADEWSIITEGSGSQRDGSGTPWSTRHWGVIKIEHLGDSTVADNAYMFLDPDPNVEPTNAMAVASMVNGVDSGARDFSGIDYMRPFVGNTSGTVGNTNHRPFAVLAVDEIRVGTTYADMRATPEPTTALLFVLGGLALSLGRSRR